MTVNIPLRVCGYDPGVDDMDDAMGTEGLSDLFWETIGAIVLANVLYDGSDDPVAEAMRWAGKITRAIPGATVTEVFDELVGIPEIARRAEATSEAVRLWATGRRRAATRPFPQPRQVVYSGDSDRMVNLYAWREVLSWIREVIGTDPDPGITHLGDRDIADLNLRLCGREEAR